MSARVAGGRWVLSFADLCLLLLGFFVLLQAQPGDRRRLADGLRATFGPRPAGASLERRATLLFEPGEAVLRPAAAAELAAFARGAPRLTVESRGTEAGGARLDGWELAAARAAAVARALDLPAQRIGIRVADTIGGGQWLTLVRG